MAVVHRVATVQVDTQSDLRQGPLPDDIRDCTREVAHRVVASSVRGNLGTSLPAAVYFENVGHALAQNMPSSHWMSSDARGDGQDHSARKRGASSVIFLARNLNASRAVLEDSVRPTKVGLFAQLMLRF